MKWIWRVFLKIQSGHDSVHRRTDGRMDRRTDGQGETSIHPFQLRWSGGYKNVFFCQFLKLPVAFYHNCEPDDIIQNGEVDHTKSCSTLSTKMHHDNSSAPSHYLNQCWHIVKWTLRNKFQWNLIKKTKCYPSSHWPETVTIGHVSAHFRSSLGASMIFTHIRTKGLYVKTTINYQSKCLCILDCAYTEDMFINSIHISLYDISLT